MNKTFKIITSCLLMATTMFAFCSCGSKTENKKETVSTNEKPKQIVEHLVGSVDFEFDKVLDTDTLENYNKVGVLNGEDLYSFNNISYINLIKRFNNRMEESVIEQELYLRGFYTASNNILFTTNSEFLKKKKLYATEFTYFSELDRDTVVQSVPKAEETLENLSKKGYTDFSFFRVNLSSASNNSEKTEENTYEVIYTLAKSEKHGYKIVDAIYYLDGKTQYMTNKPHIDIEGIENFVPNTFEQNRATISKKSNGEDITSEEPQAVETISETE